MVHFDSRAYLACACGLLSALGCSLAQTNREDCTPQACREAFGLRSVCGDEGLCEISPAESRCSVSFPEDLLLRPEAYTDILVVGSLFDRSLATHRARENAIRLAFRGANDQNGLEGRRFGVIFCNIAKDAAFDPLDRTQAAVAMAGYLRDVYGVRAIIGPAASQDTLAVAEALRGDDVLVISPSATSPILTDLDPVPASDETPGLVWRTAPPDSLQGIAIAEDMRGRVPTTETSTRVAVVFETGPYGEFLADAFQRRFRDLGGMTTASSFETSAERDEAILRAVAGDERADEVLFVSSQTQDVIAFLRAVETNPSYDGVKLFVTDSAANFDVVDNTSPAILSRVRGTRQAPLDEEENFVFRLFLTAYSGAYGEDARQYSFVANAFDAAWLVAYGMAWAELRGGPSGPFGPGGSAIARGLRRTYSGQPVEIRASSWPDVLASFRAGVGVDVTGASSDLDFDPDTEEFRAPIEVWVVRDRQFEGVRRFSLQSP